MNQKDPVTRVFWVVVGVLFTSITPALVAQNGFHDYPVWIWSGITIGQTPEAVRNTFENDPEVRSSPTGNEELWRYTEAAGDLELIIEFRTDLRFNELRVYSIQLSTFFQEIPTVLGIPTLSGTGRVEQLFGPADRQIDGEMAPGTRSEPKPSVLWHYDERNVSFVFQERFEAFPGTLDLVSIKVFGYPLHSPHPFINPLDILIDEAEQLSPADLLFVLAPDFRIVFEDRRLAIDEAFVRVIMTQDHPLTAALFHADDSVVARLRGTTFGQARQAQRGAEVPYLIAPGGEDDPIREVQLDVYGSVFLISEIQVRGNAPAAE